MGNLFRPLEDSDAERLRSFLEKDGLRNLFFKADLSNHGMKSGAHEFLGLFSGERLAGVVMRYFATAYVSLTDTEPSEEMIRYIADRNTVCGIPEYVERLRARLALAAVRIERFAVLNRLAVLPQAAVPVTRAEPDDCGALFELQKAVEEFGISEDGRDGYCASLLNGTGRAAYVRIDGRIVSSATSVAEYDEAGMIIGVATLKEHRGMGYASSCVRAVCESLLDEGKTPCLYYDNAAAGRIYERLGFEYTGGWASAAILKGNDDAE